MVKLLFYGFRHYHIYSFYKQAAGDKRVEIVACIEEDTDARRRAEEELGVVFSDKSMEQWLCSIDAVVLGGRYGERGSAAIKALSYGKHVISDKPICTSLDELYQIRALIEQSRSKQNELTIACLFDLRYLPAVGRAKQILKSGVLGEIRNISFTGQHCIDYEHRPQWYFEPNMQGGTINDLAIHGLDLLNYLCNLSIKRTLAARTWNAYAYKNPEFEDCAIFMAELSNGAGLLADVSYSAPSQVFEMPTYWNFKIWCEKGLITFNAANPELRVFAEASENDGTCVEKGAKIYAGIESESTIIDDFLQCVDVKNCPEDENSSKDENCPEDEGCSGSEGCGYNKNASSIMSDSVLKATEMALELQKAANNHNINHSPKISFGL